jgi:phthiocerol/phenolphthiocerol synthesis type-I polyketide synthase E
VQLHPTRQQLLGMGEFDRTGALAEAVRQALAHEISAPPSEIDLDAPLDAPHAAWASGASRDWRQVLDACLASALGRQFYVYEIWSREGGGSVVRERTTLREVISYVLAELSPRPISSRTFDDPCEGARWELELPAAAPGGQALRPAVFLLSSARSGSTLTRVMLHGNPSLFAAPELFLLMWDSLSARRRDMVAHGYEWFDRGFRATLVELGITAEADLDATLARLVAADTSVREAYRVLQDAVSPRLLVDKTPPYALNPDALARAEALFTEPKYICLTRHPMAVIESWGRMKFHGTLFGRHLGVWDDDPYRYAEKWWAATYTNLRAFSETIPSDRVLWVAFEDVLRRPAFTCARISDFLGVQYDDRMTRPYADERMQAEHGDPNLRARRELDPSLADAWRASPPEMRLSEFTRSLARDLGYEDV